MPTYCMTGVPWVIHDDQSTVSFLTDNGTASGHNDYVWQIWTTTATTTNATGILMPSGAIGDALVQTWQPLGIGYEEEPASDVAARWQAAAAARLQLQEDMLRRSQERELENAHTEALERNRDFLRRDNHERARDIARGKAMAILCEHLDRAQIASLVKHDYFKVRSQHGKLYEIELGHGRNVREIEPGAGGRGWVTAVYCAHPRNAYEMPDCDSMLVQLLMLKYSEHAFLKIANRHHVGAEIVREAA